MVALEFSHLQQLVSAQRLANSMLAVDDFPASVEDAGFLLAGTLALLWVS